MPNKLVNLEVHYLSLVKQGANRREIIWKAVDSNPDWVREVPIRKTDAEKRMVYGVVYAPDEIDAHGDFTTADEIEKAAYGFMKNLRLRQIDKDHSFDPAPAYVAESWLVRAPDPLFQEEKEGAWAVGIKIEDDSLWEAVKGGEYKALSLAGFCERVNLEKAWKKAPEDTPWDFRAADYTVEQLARACAWVRGVDDPHRGRLPEDLTKADCKLPHHLPDGTLVLRGIMAAGAAIQGARGGVDISPSDLPRVKRHLEQHYHEFDRKAPWETEKTATEETLYRKFVKWLAGETAGKEKQMQQEEVLKAIQEAIAPLAARIEALEKQDAVGKGELETALKPILESLEVLLKAAPGTKQDNNPISPISPDDYYRIGLEIAKYARKEA